MKYRKSYSTPYPPPGYFTIRIWSLDIALESLQRGRASRPGVSLSDIREKPTRIQDIELFSYDDQTIHNMRKASLEWSELHPFRKVT